MPPPITQLSEQELAALKSAYETYTDLIKKAEQERDIRKSITDTIQAQIDYENERSRIMQGMTEYQNSLNELKQKESDLDVARQTSNAAIIKAAKDEVDKAKERVKLFEKQIELADKYAKKLQEAFKKGEEAADAFFGRTKSIFDGTQEEIEKTFEGFIKRATELKTIIAGINKALAAGGKMFMDGFNIPFLGVQIKGMGEILKDVIEAPTEAFKDYGYLDQYSKSIQNLTRGSEKFRATQKELLGAIGDLNQNYSGFADLNTELQTKIADTTTKLAAAGFSMKTQAVTMNVLTRVFGQTAEAANKTVISLAALGKTLGTGGKALDDFVALGPKLALFGEQTAVKVFEQTSIAAKKLGVDVQKLYDIVGNYDSFEKASEAAGNFNLFLGGQFLDPLKLMKASIEEGPVPTLKLLKKAFDDSGKDLDKLGPAFIRFGAEAAKMDPQMFKNLFKGGAGELDEYIAKQEEAKKRQDDLNKISEKTQNVFKEIQNAFAAAFADPAMIKSLVKVADTIKNIALSVSGMIKWLLDHKAILATFFAIGQFINVLNAIKAIATATRIAFGWEAALKVLKYGPVGAALVAAGAGVAAYYALSSGDNETAGAPSANLEAAGEAIEKTSIAQEPMQDGLVIPRGPQGVTISDGKSSYKTAATDNYYSAGGGGVLAAQDGGPVVTLLKQLVDRVEFWGNSTADVANRPIVLDGRVLTEQVQKQISHNNRYNPNMA